MTIVTVKPVTLTTTEQDRMAIVRANAREPFLVQRDDELRYELTAGKGIHGLPYRPGDLIHLACGCNYRIGNLGADRWQDECGLHSNGPIPGLDVEAREEG